MRLRLFGFSRPHFPPPLIPQPSLLHTTTHPSIHHPIIATALHPYPTFPTHLSYQFPALTPMTTITVHPSASRKEHKIWDLPLSVIGLLWPLLASCCRQDHYKSWTCPYR